MAGERGSDDEGYVVSIEGDQALVADMALVDPIMLFHAVRDLAEAYQSHPASLAEQRLLEKTQPMLRDLVRDLLRHHFEDSELASLRDAINELLPEAGGD